MTINLVQILFLCCSSLQASDKASLKASQKQFKERLKLGKINRFQTEQLYTFLIFKEKNKKPVGALDILKLMRRKEVTIPANRSNGEQPSRRRERQVISTFDKYVASHNVTELKEEEIKKLDQLVDELKKNSGLENKKSSVISYESEDFSKELIEYVHKNIGLNLVDRRSLMNDKQ